MKQRNQYIICIAAIVCCGIMAAVDGILRPGYVLKSIIKIVSFLLIPLVLSLMNSNLICMQILRPKKEGILTSLLLGIGIYALIIGSYFLIGPYFDFSKIADSLTSNAGVTKENFLFVSIYISFINSLLEEFFFRGFIFSNLRVAANRSVAYLFSALLFSFYHVAIMIGWFSPALFLLVMTGLTVGGVIFNWLNEKLDTIYASWLTHMFANFAINTIGFILLNQ